MKTAFLGLGSYAGPAPAFDVWPAPPACCDRAIASTSLRQTIALCRRAEELGFDWISVSEHHYAPYMMTPNPLVLAGALSQVVQHAKIALLGPLIPLNNPVRLAEEIAMLDSMTDGRVLVLFLRGTPNEFFTYDTNVATTRGVTPPPLTPLIVRPYFLGSPSTILRRMQTLRECGVGVVDMDFVIGSYDQQLAAMEICARKMLPEIRTW